MEQILSSKDYDREYSLLPFTQSEKREQIEKWRKEGMRVVRFVHVMVYWNEDGSVFERIPIVIIE